MATYSGSCSPCVHRILKALGLDGKSVASMAIHFPNDDAVKMYFVTLPSAAEIDAISQEIESGELVCEEHHVGKVEPSLVVDLGPC